MAKWWQEALSLGAAGRVEDAIADHERTMQRAQRLAEKVEARRQEVAVVLAELVTVKQACLPVLAQIRLIAKNIGARERQVSIEATEAAPEIAVARIQSTLDAAELAKSAAKGLVAGASTAMGAWALAGSYGVASTGTALASLSGAAAQSATLAWFGGGSLAAGGAGAAGGAALIGGVVAVPALAVVAILAHSRANKQIAQIARDSATIEKAINDMMSLALVIDLTEQRARELIGVVGKARAAFEHEFRQTYRRLYSWGWLSRGWRWIRKKLGLGYFRPDELEAVQGILKVAAEFAGILDQRVIERDGSVRKEAA